MNIFINTSGRVRLLYADDLAELQATFGVPKIARASHVEPTPAGKWTADMSPVGGVVLGPFDLRSQALDAERKFLDAMLGAGL